MRPRWDLFALGEIVCGLSDGFRWRLIAFRSCSRCLYCCYFWQLHFLHLANVFVHLGNGKSSRGEQHKSVSGHNYPLWNYSNEKWEHFISWSMGYTKTKNDRRFIGSLNIGKKCSFHKASQLIASIWFWKWKSSRTFGIYYLNLF